MNPVNENNETEKKGKRTDGLSINVENLKSTFTGMTKDELMAFATDPFWVRIRRFLFVGFWLIWLSMLVAAIFIAVSTPECVKLNRSWYERSPIYEINMNHLSNSQTYNHGKTVYDIMHTKITYLKELGVETILLKSALKTTESEDEIIDFKKINVALGSLYNLQELIKYAKEKGIHVLLEFTPNHSSDKNELFARSVLKEDTFTDFYVWVSSDTKDASKPPNNWVSVYGGSAWEYQKDRKQFYLHQFNKTQPDFNFRSPGVLTHFEDVLHFWLGQGIDGFHLDKTEFLVEDAELKDERLSYKAGYTHDQYEFYMHKYTLELPETADILKKWSDIISNNSGILSVSGGIGDRKDIANLVVRPLTLAVNFSADALNNTIQSWIRYREWPVWKWVCESKLEEDCFPETVKDGLTIVSLLLPGTPVTHLGQEYGYPYNYISKDSNKSPNDQFQRTQETIVGVNQQETPNSHYNIYKSLLQLRKSPVIMFGLFKAKVVDGTIFCFTRKKADSDGGYLIVWNLGTNSVVLNLRNVDPSIPEQVIVQVKSNHQFDLPEDKRSVSSSEFKLPAKGAIVFSFNI